MACLVYSMRIPAAFTTFAKRTSSDFTKAAKTSGVDVRVSSEPN